MLVQALYNIVDSVFVSRICERTDRRLARVPGAEPESLATVTRWA